MERWFFLDDGHASGAENMATDEFLLASCEEGMRPVLRFYRFDPPAITVGYHQNPEEILKVSALENSPVDIVRRITGGRALLHEGEITYSLAAPLACSTLGTTLRETYFKISLAISKALEDLGLNTRISDGRKYKECSELKSPCIASSSRDELTVRGKKLVCSSQRRTGKAFLQHGSILLTSHSSRITDYLKGTWESLSVRITSVSQEIGHIPDIGMMTDSLKIAFSNSFGVKWIPLELSVEQRARIFTIAQDKKKEFLSLQCGKANC